MVEVVKLCECGCGRPAPIAKWTDPRFGHVKGQPMRFIHNHHGRRNVLQRFWEKVSITSGCWNWKGRLVKAGYGQFWTADGQKIRPHRFAYELFFGSVPDGLVLDHLCRNPSCVNPIHLEPVTNIENVLRGVSPPALNAKKIHCLRGHEYIPSNTYFDPLGKRSCRICRRMASRNYYKKRKHHVSPETKICQD